MKICLRCFGILLFSMTGCIGAITAQESPSELISEAQIRFEKAFEAEFGEAPSETETNEAMSELRERLNLLASDLGKSLGKNAFSLNASNSAIENRDGLAFLNAVTRLPKVQLGKTKLVKLTVREFLETKDPTSSLSGETLSKNKDGRVESGTEITFPSGTFELNDQELTKLLGRKNGSFPSGISFVGDGKSKTRIRLSGLGLGAADVEKLSFKNMMIDCQNDGWIQKRNGALTLQLSNVRLVGFDGGHPGCTLFSVNEGLVLHASDCEIAGGFGHSPGDGYLFGNSKAIVAHFENCSFRGIENDLLKHSKQPNARIWFDDCVFETKYRESPTVSFLSCKFDARPALRRDDFSDALDNGLGIEFLRLLQTQRRRPIAKTQLRKTDVEILTAPKPAAKVVQAQSLIDDLESAIDLNDYSTIVFPAGSFELDEQSLSSFLTRARKQFPDGITFVGAGKDKTTLKFSDASLTRSDVDRLGFQNMTIDCDNDGMFDKRIGKLTLQLSNVRFVRFDAGRSCHLFGVRDGLIVHARDSDFLGGYGTSTGNGKLFNKFDESLIGHFENCSFFGIKHDIFESSISRRTKLWMDNCKFDRLYAAAPSVTFSECKFDAKHQPVNWSPADTD